MIDTLLEAFALKEVPRTGWRRRGMHDVESVAAHSWGMAWLVLVLAPPHLDRERMLVYALLHDLAEAWTGDIPPQDGVRDKGARERAAMTELFDQLGRQDLLDVWLAYEERQDDEARFVHQLDRLDMALQARRYASALDPAEFFRSAAERVTDARLEPLLDGARASLAHTTFRVVGSPDDPRVQLAEALLSGPFPTSPRCARPCEEVASVLAETGTRWSPHADTPDASSLSVDGTPADIQWSLPLPAPDDVTLLRTVRDALRARIAVLHCRTR